MLSERRQPGQKRQSLDMLASMRAKEIFGETGDVLEYSRLRVLIGANAVFDTRAWLCYNENMNKFARIGVYSLVFFNLISVTIFFLR